MKFISMGSPGELGLALLLLVLAVGVDFLWFRPQQTEYRELLDRKWDLEKELHQTRRERTQALEEIFYVSGDSTGNAWPGGRPEDPVLLLERLRKETGLAGEDLSLLKRESENNLQRTMYTMSVNGNFKQQVEFLRSLEQATPLVKVDEFNLIDRPRQRGITLKMDIAVIAPEGGR